MMQVAPPPTGADRPRRYELLDALRGIAAIAVLLYHIGCRVGAPRIVGHGYLAVDFFFMLSGFVLAHAYGRRLPDMSIARFALLRTRRLLPLSALGIAIGTAYLTIRLAIYPALSDPASQLAAASALNLLWVPKLWSAVATDGELFPANGAMWSLSLEMVVNLMWVAWMGRGRPWLGVAAAVIGGLALVLLVRQAGTADLGWNLDTYAGGFARSVFGFFAGILLYRWRPAMAPNRQWPLWSTLALLAILAIPTYHWLIDIGAILIAFPLILMIAASVTFDRVPPVVRALGKLSYPLYALHVPVLMFVSGGLKVLAPAIGSSLIIYVVAVPIIALALLADLYYDQPIHRYFARAAAARPPVRVVVGGKA